MRFGTVSIASKKALTMEYVEIAISRGPGTLTKHYVADARIIHEMRFTGLGFAVQTLTETEAQEFHAMHGGWVAV
jgi:hypothetical protein